MNKNFTRKESKSFKSKVSGFFSFLPALPAMPAHVVNSVLVTYNNFPWLSFISKFFTENKPALKPEPVLVVNNFCNNKRSV